MKNSRFSESQILGILRQASSGIPVPSLCREHGMSAATFYKWSRKYECVYLKQFTDGLGGMRRRKLARGGAIITITVPIRHSMNNPQTRFIMAFHIYKATSTRI